MIIEMMRDDNMFGRGEDLPESNEEKKDAPRERHLTFKVDSSRFHLIMRHLHSAFDRIYVELTDKKFDGRLRFVGLDQAHVACIECELPLDEVTADDITEFGFDIDDLYPFVQALGYVHQTMLTIDVKDHTTDKQMTTMTISSGTTSVTIDGERHRHFTREEPKLNRLKRNNKLTIPSRKFKELVVHNKDNFSHISLKIVPAGLEIQLEDGVTSMESMGLKDLIECAVGEVPDQPSSLFCNKVLANILKAVPFDIDIDVFIKDEYPLIIEYEYLTVSFIIMLAPRIRD